MKRTFVISLDHGSQGLQPLGTRDRLPEAGAFACQHAESLGIQFVEEGFTVDPQGSGFVNDPAVLTYRRRSKLLQNTESYVIQAFDA